MSVAAENEPNPPPEAPTVPLIRDELVQTAVKFLQNPKVLKTSLADQQKFLRRKGLTDDEIREACERSGAYINFEQLNRPAVQYNGPPPPLPYSHIQQGMVHYGWFEKLKDVVHSAAALSFVAYIVYKFYQKFIAPFLFGKKKKSVEESIDSLDKNITASVDDLRTNLNSVKVEVDRINQGAESSTQRQLSDLKSEIATVKGLLLSRNQFPPVSKSSVIRPSIPAWQKTSISQDSDPDSDPERKAEDLLEIGSGSGSSEPEHNTKTSDSSLEIISFSSKDSDFRRHKNKEQDLDDKDLE